MSRKSRPPKPHSDAGRAPGVHRTPDPAGVLPEVVGVQFGGDVAAEVSAMAEILAAASPQGRIDRIALVAGMGAVVADLKARLDATGGIADHRLDADISRAEHRALYLKAQAPLVRDRLRQAGTRKPRATRWPLLDAWLDEQLSADSTVTAKGLWKAMHCMGGDGDLYLDGDRVVEQHVQSGRERGTLTFPGFQKRVTLARNRRK